MKSGKVMRIVRFVFSVVVALFIAGFLSPMPDTMDCANARGIFVHFIVYLFFFVVLSGVFDMVRWLCKFSFSSDTNDNS